MADAVISRPPPGLEGWAGAKAAGAGLWGACGADDCSTAAPSPALSAQVTSPYASFFIGGPSTISPKLHWRPMPEAEENHSPSGSEFALPDAEVEDLAGFALSGIMDFELSVAHLLADLEPTPEADEDVTCRSLQAEIDGVMAAEVPRQRRPRQRKSKKQRQDQIWETPEHDEVQQWQQPLDMVEDVCGESYCAYGAGPLDLPAGCTTVMLRNLPNKYMRDRLIQQLHDSGFRGDIDFIYLPVDFRNKCNVGYAFVNFRTPEACMRFATEYHGVDSRAKLPGFNSKKVLEVSAARVQGLDPNVRRLRGSPVLARIAAHPDWKPLLLDEEGRPKGFPGSAGTGRQ